jgi:very-short-patch-repair endonuclease
MKYGHVKTLPRSRSAQRAKTRLKEQATPDERTLIVALDVAREPYSFQYVVPTPEATRGYYVVDFYLPRRKLLVELDGEPHVSETAQWRDSLRTEAIERARPDDLLVRFWNADVRRDAAGLVRFMRTY